MTDHDDAVGGQMHIQLESIGTGGVAAIERGDSVFRPERAAAAMREHQTLVIVEESHMGGFRGSLGAMGSEGPVQSVQ
jgi:hypothetical protein